MKRDKQRTLRRRGPNGPSGRYRAFADAFQDFVAKVDLPGLAIDPNEMFGGARDMRLALIEGEKSGRSRRTVSDIARRTKRRLKRARYESTQRE